LVDVRGYRSRQNSPLADFGILVVGGSIHHEAVSSVVTSIMALAFGRHWFIHFAGVLVCFDALAFGEHGFIFISTHFGLGG
jgi:hypothetical protein